MEGDVTERTPLHAGGGAPMYVFSPNPSRLYRNRVRHFQCCVCAAILAMFVLAVVIAVSYSINGDIQDRNATVPNASEIAEQQLQVLLSAKWPIDDAAPEGAWPSSGPSPPQLTAALAAGRAAATDRRKLEAAMPQLPLDSPSFRHQMAMATGASANASAVAGFSMVEATKLLVKDMAKPPGERGPRAQAPWQPGDVCADEDGVDAGGFPPCPPAAELASPWRAYDGRCNNRARPWLGAAMRPFRRVLPAAYADGVSAPRSGRGGGALPSAREVSVTVHRPQYRDDAAFSILLAVWGQFIDHDITATALSKRSTDGGAISCCYAAKTSGLKAHPECFPVMLGPEDPYFQQYNVTCMEFVRSAAAAACRFGPREQLNQATSFLDGSVVYGSNEEMATKLRTGTGGLLKMLVTQDGRELLPASTDPNDGCNRAEESAKGRYCFLTGDARANENLHLTTLHLLLARQHNRLASAMHQMNPQWGDERLFQEARRVVVAQMQHITYSEFVPILLGNELMEKLALQPKEDGYSTDYDPNADPRIANVFAAAAFRFAHTLLPGLMRMIRNTSSEYVELHKVLFNPFTLYGEGGEGPALRGALHPGLLRFDPHFSPEVSQHLFQRATGPPGTDAQKAGPCGLDLVSLNIQRGRDHGLPPYPAWRKHCKLSVPENLSDLQGIVDDDSLARIAAIYRSVEDIDPYTGMLAELPVPGGMLGPTLTCILADQFVRIRRGDRYWYETEEMPQAFTAAQLSEVRKTSLAQLLCDTSDAVTSIQRWVLRAPSDSNPRVACASLPRPNLGAWEGSPDPAPPPPAGPAARVTSAGSAARAFGPGAPPSAAIDPGVTFMRPLRLGAYVYSARVSSAAGHAWYAAFPLEIKLPLFDSIAGPGDGSVAGPEMNYAHGILWEGALVPTSPGFLALKGEFSLPKYIHGDDATNFTIEWINGDFEFELQVLWNSSDVSNLDVQGSYVSAVYLGAREKYEGLVKTSPSKLFDVTGEFRESPSLDIDPKVKKAPIILMGTYSADGTSFFWSGNVSAVIPDAVPVTPWTKSNYWSDVNAEVPLKEMPWIPRYPKVETLSASAGVSSAVGISVLRGSATVAENGTSTTWWDGLLPLAIPIPAFNRVVKMDSKPSKSDKGKPKPTYSSGVTWDAILKGIDDKTINVQGNFSIPIFVHGPGALFSMDWKKGMFSLDFSVVWNASSLESVFKDGKTYSSSVFFVPTKPTETINQIIVGLQESSEVEGSTELQFVSAAMADEGKLPKAPIILHGNYTPDKTHFIWIGNATIILPTITGPVLLQMALKDPSTKPKLGKVAVGANVLSGTIIGQETGKTSDTLWNGDLPMPIRAADVLSKGIIWKGQFTSTSLTATQLQGTFSAILPGKSNSSQPFLLYQGKFSLQLGLLWNVSTNGLVPPETMVYSPIYIRGSSAPDDAEGWFATDEDPTSQRTNTQEIQAPAGSLRAPIILQGVYSSDLSTFWWSGRTIIIFSSPNVPSENMLQVRKKLILRRKSKPLLTSWYGIPWGSEVAAPQPGLPYMRPLRFAATVHSGSIKTAAGSAWSGSLPLELKLPLFDTVAGPGDSAPSIPDVPPVYGHGIVWEGTISSETSGKISFYGKFSMPRYVHGGGFTNFSVQWINGNFDFEMAVLWNTSDITGLAIQGSYSSPVFLRAQKMYTHITSETANSISNVEGALSQSPSLTPSPLIKKAPIILMGGYSPDGKSFLWSGNISVVIPDIVPVTWATNSLWAEDNGAIPFQKMSLVPQQPQLENLPASEGTSSAMGISVTTGHINVTSNGTSARWWDGTLPLSIPMPAFNKIVKSPSMKSSSGKKSGGDSKSSYSTGLTWDASLQQIDPETLRIKGNYATPIFIYGPGSPFSIDWKKGDFAIDFHLIWNATSLEVSFQNNTKYSSPVFFKVTKPSDTINDIIVGLQEASDMDGSTELQFLADAAGDSTALPRAPIILHGQYTSDKTHFEWNGNATVILPSPKGFTMLQMGLKQSVRAKSTSGSVAIGANVSSGSIVAGSDESRPSTMWSGEIPVPIRRPDLLSRGIVWKGDIYSLSPTEAKIEGAFSAMWPSSMGETYPYSLYQGKFSIQLELLWNASVDNILPSGATIYSPIYLRGSSSPPESEAWFAIDEDIGREVKQTKTPPEAAGALTVPVILQGSYSPDLTTFWWSGKVFIIFPGLSPPIFKNIIRNAQEQLIFSSQSEKFLPKMSQAKSGTGYVMAAKKEIDNASFLRPLRLGATVYWGSITTSAGRVWSGGSLPLEIPLPLFDSVVVSGEPSPSVSDTPAVYAHGILWEGSLSESTVGILSFTGKFSMPRYIHGGGLTNFSIQWVNGNFDIGLKVLWSSSDITGLKFEGLYSSPVYLAARKKYSQLQNVSASVLSDVSDAIKLTPSVTVGPVLKKAPIVLLGTYSPTGKSFIWSGNVTFIIPDVVPVTTPSVFSQFERLPPKEQLKVKAPSANPGTTSALGVSVEKGKISVFENSTTTLWWDGTYPLAVPIPAFTRTVTSSSDKEEVKPSYTSGAVWDATLEHVDNTTLRLVGNFSVPLKVKSPGPIFSFEWKKGNFSIDFNVLWNSSSVDNIFQASRKYYSPIYFRASRPSENIQDIFVGFQETREFDGSAELQFISDSVADADGLPPAPIILNGKYSIDKSQFFWYGNATILLPASFFPVTQQISIPSSSGTPIKPGSRAVGTEVIDGSVFAGESGMPLSSLWNGALPFPIRRPDLMARGITWKGEFTDITGNQTTLEGTFSTTWPSSSNTSTPLTLFQGKFSLKLYLLWKVTLMGLIPPETYIYSPIYLRGTTISKEDNEQILLTDKDINPERLSVQMVETDDVSSALRVPIILQGTYSPDLTTFWWTGRMILAFPRAPPSTVALLETAEKIKSASVGAVVTSGAVLNAKGEKIWNGVFPVTLTPVLKQVLWSGSVIPAVGGTVELRGMFSSGGASGEYAFVVTPLWSTPLAERVVPGTNYTSRIFMRDPNDPPPKELVKGGNSGKVPIILQGTFSADKSTFDWSGSVVIAFPDVA